MRIKGAVCEAEVRPTRLVLSPGWGPRVESVVGRHAREDGMRPSGG